MEDRVREILNTVKNTAVAAGEYAGRVAGEAGKKAEDMVEVTKLNLRIFDLNADIDGLLREVGAIVYQSHLSAEASSEGIDEKLRTLDEKYAAVGECKERIQDLKQSKKCPNPECGKACGKEDTFCRACGAPLGPQD